mmetsp:Transcript_35437/g.31929  ORF Transcript_35437/g.31929 Transcript_35437/m.31929 type:complete len:355 (+) Transcript_35437:264-1328(+)
MGLLSFLKLRSSVFLSSLFIINKLLSLLSLVLLILLSSGNIGQSSLAALSDVLIEDSNTNVVIKDILFIVFLKSLQNSINSSIFGWLIFLGSSMLIGSQLGEEVIIKQEFSLLPVHDISSRDVDFFSGLANHEESLLQNALELDNSESLKGQDSILVIVIEDAASEVIGSPASSLGILGGFRLFGRLAFTSSFLHLFGVLLLSVINFVFGSVLEVLEEFFLVDFVLKLDEVVDIFAQLIILRLLPTINKVLDDALNIFSVVFTNLSILTKSINTDNVFLDFTLEFSFFFVLEFLLLLGPFFLSLLEGTLKLLFRGISSNIIKLLLMLDLSIFLLFGQSFSCFSDSSSLYSSSIK